MTRFLGVDGGDLGGLSGVVRWPYGLHWIERAVLREEVISGLSGHVG